ncbi:MAG: dihydrofolate reductase [Christensenellales bacterium]
MKTIFAVDNKWGLGRKNGLLFDLKEDMRHFVAHTKGKTVVMGSNTLLSLPGGMPLKNRVNVVLNPNGTQQDADEKGYILAKSLDELLQTIKQFDTNEVYVIGGAMMYHTLLPYCDTAYVTKVDADGNAEVFHDNLDELDNWQLVECGPQLDDNGYTIRFCTYKNSAAKPL